jgi:histone H3/H4
MWGRSNNQKAYIYPFIYVIMVIQMTEIPVAPVTRIIRNADAERVSEDASQALVELLEEYGAKISKEAVSLAKYAGRKTIKKEDIEKAAEKEK